MTMNPDLLPPPSGLPYSRLLEAGWSIAHIHHTHLAGKRSLVAIFRKGAELIMEQGEDDLTVFKKLEVKARIEDRSVLPKKEVVKADPRHKQFIDAWSMAYTGHFRCTYTFNGPIDGKALKTFLGSNDGTVPLMIDVARTAWERQDKDPFCKACKQSTSVRGFCQLWNEINAELTREVRQSGNGSTFQL